MTANSITFNGVGGSLPLMNTTMPTDKHNITTELQEKYEKEVRYSMHFYVGFEGKGFTRMDSDCLPRIMRDCRWVYSRVRKRWLKKDGKRVGR